MYLQLLLFKIVTSALIIPGKWVKRDTHTFSRQRLAASCSVFLPLVTLLLPALLQNSPLRHCTPRLSLPGINPRRRPRVDPTPAPLERVLGLVTWQQADCLCRIVRCLNWVGSLLLTGLLIANSKPSNFGFNVAISRVRVLSGLS